ncbi:MAG: ABC transporter permease [Thermoplasmata archaeon]|nr:ABC transporter permease [Thermoplasmata archaeon]
MILADSFRVAWIDIRFIRRNLPVVLVTSLVAPLLYMFVFGYGLGRDLTVEGLDYISFMVPGIVAMTTLTACFNNVATKVMLQRTYYQSFDELFLCSISPSSIILGKAFSGMVRGLISCTVLYALGMLVSDDLQLSLGAVILIVFSCLMYGLLGVVSGMLANSHLTLNMFTSLVILPMTFLCGTIFSLDSLGGGIQTAIGLLPLTHTTDCMRAAMLGQDFPWVSLLILLAWSAVFFLASRHLIVRGRA